MDTDMNERLKTARKNAGYRSAPLAAEALGLKPSTYGAYESGQNKIPSTELVHIAKKFKVDVTWLLTGDLRHSDLIGVQRASEKTRKMARSTNIGDIEQYNIFAGMGAGGLLSVTAGENGSLLDPEESDGFWSFPEKIKSRFVNIGHAKAIPLVGDSMAPTLNDGDVAFIDTSVRQAMAPAIYAIDYGDGLLVKRVQMIPKTDLVKIISDNEHYENHEVHRGDLTVYGIFAGAFIWP